MSTIPAKRSNASLGPPAAAPVQKENAASNTNIPHVETLLAMTKKQLLEELKQRGVEKGTSTKNKDGLLDMLGVPATQWTVWRKMTIKDLKQELKKRSLKVSGSKQELLGRLGVPRGFGQILSPTAEARKKQRTELEARKKLLDTIFAARAAFAAATNTLSADEHEHDPSHENYSTPCCENERHDDHDQPGGYIDFPDGSTMEVWRCLNCGGFGKFPNAPPIHEFTESDLEYIDNEGMNDGPGDCRNM